MYLTPRSIDSRDCLTLQVTLFHPAGSRHKQEERHLPITHQFF
ncbi:hypothetical protein M3J09_012534 [Ascochyta lentis]